MSFRQMAGEGGTMRRTVVRTIALAMLTIAMVQSVATPLFGRTLKECLEYDSRWVFKFDPIAVKSSLGSGWYEEEIDKANEFVTPDGQLTQHGDLALPKPPPWIKSLSYSLMKYLGCPPKPVWISWGDSINYAKIKWPDCELKLTFADWLDELDSSLYLQAYLYEVPTWTQVQAAPDQYIPGIDHILGFHGTDGTAWWGGSYYTLQLGGITYDLCEYVSAPTGPSIEIIYGANDVFSDFYDHYPHQIIDYDGSEEGYYEFEYDQSDSLIGVKYYDALDNLMSKTVITVCTASDPMGPVGYIKKVAQQKYDDTLQQWVDETVTYIIRYLTSDGNMAGQIKCVLDEDDVARLKADGYDIETDYDPVDPGQGEFGDDILQTYVSFYDYLSNGTQVFSITGGSSSSCCGGAGSGFTTTYFDYGSSSYSGVAVDHFGKTREDTKREYNPATETFQGEGTTETYYFNPAGQIIHKSIEYFDASGTSIETRHWHYELNDAGQFTAEYTPDSISWVDFDPNNNDDGSISLTYNTTGLVRVYEYYDIDTDGHNSLKYEKIKNGHSGTAITLKEYVYWDPANLPGSMSDEGILKEVIAYPDASDANKKEITAYFYDDGETGTTYDGFYDNDKDRPKVLRTVTYLDSGKTKYLQTIEYYNSDGWVQFSKDNEGHVTYTEYIDDENEQYGLVKYVVEDLDADDKPGELQDFPVSFSPAFATTTGLNKLTTYTYNDDQTTKTTTFPDGAIELTVVIEDSSNLSNYRDKNGTVMTGLDDIVETRRYRLKKDGNNYEIVAPVEVEFSLSDNGDTISHQTVTTNYTPTTTMPDGSETISKYLSRTDSVYNAASEKIVNREYPSYSGSAIDTSKYLDTRIGYHDNGSIKFVVKPSGFTTYYPESPWKENTSTSQAYREKRAYFLHTTNFNWDFSQSTIADSGFPARIITLDADDNELKIELVETSYGGTGEPTGSETISSYHSRFETLYDWRGCVTTDRRWHTIDGTPTADDYYDTTYTYDNLERRIKVTDSIGDIQKTVYDLAGREKELWAGTTVDSTETLARIALFEYEEVLDEGTPEERTVQRSYVTKAYTFGKNVQDSSLGVGGEGDGDYDNDFGSDTNSYTYTVFKPDNLETVGSALRKTSWSKPQYGPWTHVVYDINDNILSRYVYRNDSTSYLLQAVEFDYDSDGNRTRMAILKVYGGALVTPEVALTTTYEYDDAGRMVKVTQPGGAYRKTGYDAMGRVIATYTCTAEGTTTDIDNVTGDTVVEQEENIYDDKGLLVASVSYRRQHDDTSTTGALTTSNANFDVGITWYDKAERAEVAASCGQDSAALVDNDTDGVPDVAESTPPDPSNPGGRTDTYLVSKTIYDNSNRVSKKIGNDGVVTKWTYDCMHRTTSEIENFTGDGTPSTTANRTTAYAYNGADQLTSITAVYPNSADNQTTTAEYGPVGVTGLASTQDGIFPIPSKGMLVRVTYPDPDLGANDSNQVTWTYYADGAPATRTDQRQVKLINTYNDLKLRVSSKADLTDVPAAQNVDDTIKYLKYDYDEMGRLTEAASYAQQGDQTPINRVVNTYDTWGKRTSQQQDVDGTGTSPMGSVPTVSYAYDSTNVERLSKVTYPNGRDVHYLYTESGGTSGVSDTLSRIRAIATASTRGTDDVNVIADYQYNGVSQVIRKTYPTPQLRLDRFGEYNYSSDTLSANSGTYAGLDKFGRVTKTLWYDIAGSSVVFDIHQQYDAASNPKYAERKVYREKSQVYTYDSFNRLTNYKVGSLELDGQGDPVTPRAIETNFMAREQDFGLDILGNKETLKDYKTDNWVSGTTFNKANEFGNQGSGQSNRTVKFLGKNKRINVPAGGFSGLDYEVRGTDTWQVNPQGYLVASTLVQDTSISENESRALVLFDEEIGPQQLFIAFENNTGTEYAGIVFGYQGDDDYWMLVLDVDEQQYRLYHVEDGVKGSVLASAAGSYSYGGTVYGFFTRHACQLLGYNFTGGFPSGRCGVVTNMANTKFWMTFASDDDLLANSAGRWMNNSSSISADVSTNFELILKNDFDGRYNPALIRNSNAAKFDAVFSARHSSSQSSLRFVFDARDQNDYKAIQIPLKSSNPVNPSCYSIKDGKAGALCFNSVQTTEMPSVGTSDTLWCRVVYDGTNVTVQCAVGTTEPDWGQVNNCYSITGGFLSQYYEHPMQGGYMGFAADGGQIGYYGLVSNYIKTVRVKTWDDDSSSWVTQFVDDFTSSADRLQFDAAGNLTYDGSCFFTYDAWNSLIKVQRAWPDGDDVGDYNCETGSTIATIEYDALGRRTVKTITNSGEQDGVYRYYYDGYQVIEVRNGSGYLLKQQVWGLTYIDELVQIALNRTPGQDEDDQTAGVQESCEHTLYVMQDARYNVLGIAAEDGRLVERYEFTPYGERTIYSHGWTAADLDEDGDYDSADLSLYMSMIADEENGTPRQQMLADFNCDGVVSGLDTPGFKAAYTVSMGANSNDPLVRYPVLHSRAILNGAVVPLCEFGHQGLMHDDEFGLVNNRSRMLHPRLMRFCQRDPQRYVDGMSMYQPYGGNPITRVDPFGGNYGDNDPDRNRRRREIQQQRAEIEKDLEVVDREASRIRGQLRVLRSMIHRLNSVRGHAKDDECRQFIDDMIQEIEFRIITTQEAEREAIDVKMYYFGQLNELANMETVIDNEFMADLQKKMFVMQGALFVMEFAPFGGAVMRVMEGDFKGAAFEAAMDLSGTGVFKKAGKALVTGAKALDKLKSVRRLKQGIKATRHSRHVMACRAKTFISRLSGNRLKLRGCFVAGTHVYTADGRKAIETIRVGDRVLSSSGEETADEDDDPDLSGEVDPATWRTVTLKMPHPDLPGTLFDIVLLRPLSWIEATGCAEGAVIPLALPEMGVEGTAKVGSIGPCPPIAEGPGRVVLMTIGHINPSIVRLKLEGHDEPIELTWLHRLYSEDAAAWLPAGELRPGASLRTRTAPVRIESIEQTRPAQRVYNIHVQHTHCFYVADAGVLSHNTNTCPIPKEGIYEFTDQITGLPYVGQSGDLSRRLAYWERAGRYAPGDGVKLTAVPGGKTAREIAEFKRIRELTGGVPARYSDDILNMIDPIGEMRRIMYGL